MNARLLIVIAALAVGSFACGSESSSTAAGPATSSSESTPHSGSTPSSNDSGSGAGSGSGKLDPQVSAPAGFPSDLPVYGGARLTTGVSSSAAGSTTYAMVWETTDSESQVQAYYASQLGQGNWTLILGSGGNGAYAAEFTRKGSGKATGTMAIVTDSSTGVTKVTLSLVVVA